MANVQMIIKLLSELAPEKYAYEWDNVGIQVGSYNKNIKNVLLTLDIDYRVLEEADKKDCSLIISHHPVIFNGLDSIHDQTETGRVIMKAIKKDITLYSAHTNLDMARGGLNDYLSELLNLTDLSPLKIAEKKNYFKLVIFGPEDSLDRVREAVLEKGAGQIGDYSYTSYTTAGEGTFKPGEGSDPYLGKKGELARVDEFRFETIVRRSNIDKVVQAAKDAHPYEEMAYDIYPVENKFEKDSVGLGRIGFLEYPIKLGDYIQNIKDILGLSVLRFCGNKDKIIKKVAVCSGSGADLITTAKFSGADLYITGDLKYHEAQHAEKIGLNLVDAGHYGTENIVKELLFEYLNDKIKEKKYEVNLLKSEINTNPWQYI